MKIWIDLANSPQVLFFRPIVKELERRGHRIKVTTRAYAQTVQLADQFGMTHNTIGRHGGASQWGLAGQISLRSLMLANWARTQGFDLAVSHNSYGQAVAAWLLRIPAVTLMDYEHQPLNHLCFRLAKRVIVPEFFPAEFLKKFGASEKTLTYPGVKEQIYLSDFVPDPHYREKEGLPINVPLIVIRPPAPWTAYHHFENDIFNQLLVYLSSSSEKNYLLFLPRLINQGKEVERIPGLKIATKVFDGPNLLACADVVISGGGTMNREAAVLGAATYTVFKGILSAVDTHLISSGRMSQLSRVEDFSRIRIEARNGKSEKLSLGSLIPLIADLIEMEV